MSVAFIADKTTYVLGFNIRLDGKFNLLCNMCLWVPVTTAWRVLRLRMEERPPIRRVAANKLNKQSRTADKGWSSSLGGWARR